MSPAATLERLADRVREEVPPAGRCRWLQLRQSVAWRSGRRRPPDRRSGADYAFVVEAVREGYLCHYGSPRVLEAADQDLALLAGDLFYAIGISGLAQLPRP